MNRAMFYQEISKLKEAVELLEEVADKLRHAQEDASEDWEDVAYLENDAALLSIAAEIIEKTLPEELITNPIR